MPPGRGVTFVCCIEQGRLEAQTLLMLNCLRQFGGDLAQAPVLAVMGRRGLPLARATVAELDRLQAHLVRLPERNPAPWFNYANKVVAVVAAERLAATEQVTWLDSDVLVAAEPAGLRLAAQEDFAARCEFLPPAVLPHHREHEPYWERLCRLLGTDYERLPWLEREGGLPPVRMFFNSGVFSWRRGTAFAAAYADAFGRLLSSRLATHEGHFFTADQVILGPVVLREGLRWRHLAQRDHHMCFQGLLDGPAASPSMAAAAVVHYSKAMQPPFRERFLQRLSVERPVLYRYILQVEGTLPADKLAAPTKLAASALRVVRGAHWRWYARRIERAPRLVTS
ncbi:hypothetical protein [Aquabacterium sp. J223]|uniref:hypothetical protein n=1 Tax=Aquabacterium sp. J223 TaxID=2898431 RepID=UPI0028A1A580|nr:hypothetical protein [Aquabacterium sp. J223]